MNKLMDQNIVLDKDAHEYSLLTQTDLVFTSVTTFIDQFFEGFDSEKIATNLVETNPRYAGRTVESLIAEWAATGEHGTQIHDEIDNWIKNGIEPIETKAINGKKWLQKYKLKSDINVLSEVIVYSTDLMIAGTMDILALDKTTGRYELIDWKTSKKIKTVSYGYKMGTSRATDAVMDCNFNHYALQLSLYRYLLENYYDIDVHNQLIVHLQDDGARSLVAPYMQDHIVAMLNN